MSSLPPELWDHTIECLAPDRIAGPAEHYADLRACALTCQRWLPRAQHQLYKHVELRRLASIRLFARTLEHSPHLCPLVRRLEFWCMKGDPEWDPQGDEPDAEGVYHLRPAPVADVPFPAHLIRSLTALHGLRFACFTESPGHTEVVVEFLQKWAGCPGVRTLWLDGFYFNALTELTEIVWSFPGLEEFNVFQTGWALVGLAVDPAEFPGRCEKLTNVEMQETDRVDDLLPLLGTAIQRLSISWMWDAWQSDTYAAINSLLDLRSLQIQINYLSYDWVTTILAQVRSTHLEELVLDFHLLSSDQEKEGLKLFAREEFDEFLSRTPLDGVRRLKIMTFGNEKTGKTARWLREMQAKLPRFMKRGIVKVELMQSASEELSVLTGEEYED